MLDISGGELVTKEANSIGTGRICRGRICKGAKPLTLETVVPLLLRDELFRCSPRLLPR